MEQLPDNILVMLLQYLEMPDLLTCRFLCKRFRDLTLLPDVWQHRAMTPSAPWLCPVLRLAPCLDAMYCLLPPVKQCHMPYTSTRCAVEELRLIVGLDTGALHAAAVVCRQEALGRLRRVYVIFATDVNISILLSTLATTTGLETIEISAHPDMLDMDLTLPATTSAVLHSTTLTPSLRRFECMLCPESEPFVNFILAQHAATLESVDLGGSPFSMDSTSTAPLLAGIPNLRELVCCNLPGLEAVAACESLSVLDLTIRTDDGTRPFAAVASKLLLRAKHLREVSLEYAPPISSPTDIGADLVLALASSRVEKLTVRNFVCDDDEEEQHFPQMYALISALPRLPALRHLQVGVPADYVLLAISPTTAPALQLVSLSLPDEVCAHAWAHGDAVKTVMSVNPSLHLKLKCKTTYCGQDSCEEACALDCHKVLGDGDQSKDDVLVGLFSHDSVYNCPQDHTADCHWINFP